jgi:hypothetical protein
VTTVGLDLPDGCELDDQDQTIVNCLLGTILPGTSADATLDLGLDGNGGGATVTVKSGDLTLDVQAVDLLPDVVGTVGAVTDGVNDVTGGLTGGLTSVLGGGQQPQPQPTQPAQQP